MDRERRQRRTRIEWFLWFALGLLIALGLQTLEAHAMDGWEAMARVNEGAPVRPFIVQETGTFQATSRGHDGQFSLAMALDPYGSKGAYKVFDYAAYRYRRILYPLLSGGFGLLRGTAVFYGLILVAASGVGLAAASIARIAKLLGARRWVTLGVLANPGVWLSAQLLTPDALALGLGLAGVALWLRGRRVPALLLFSLSLLTKEQYVLVPLAVAGWMWTTGRRSDAALVGIVPTLPLAALAWALNLVMGEGFAAHGNLDVLGLLDSIQVWRGVSSAEQVLIGLTLAGLLVAIVAPLRAGRLACWLTWPWVLLALSSSAFVWNLGNNAARVFAPLWVFGLLAAGATASRGVQDAEIFQQLKQL